MRARYGGFLAVAAGPLGHPGPAAVEVAGTDGMPGAEDSSGTVVPLEALDTLAGGLPGDR